jgi:DnaJ-class molecular chaperone
MVQVIVRTPKNLSKEQEELLRAFEGLSMKKEKEEEGWKRFFKR